VSWERKGGGREGGGGWIGLRITIPFFHRFESGVSVGLLRWSLFENLGRSVTDSMRQGAVICSISGYPRSGGRAYIASFLHHGSGV